MSTEVVLRIMADPATEVFLMDSELRRIGSGSGQLTATVQPGYYKVRYRIGSAIHDELVEVDGTRPVLELKAPTTLHFRTAVPLDHTATTYQYHGNNARQLSRKLHRGAKDAPAQLFIFIREEDASAPMFDPTAITVHGRDGELLFSAADGESNAEWRSAGINIGLAAGTYRVRVDAGTADCFEMFVTVATGWQTQLFYVMEEFPAKGEHVRSPSLRSSSVLMAPLGDGFHPAKPDARLVELAKIGMAQGRMVLSPEQLEQMIGGKFQDPMLGLYAAHLMLMSGQERADELVDEIADNLAHMLGPCPDVQALQVRPHAAARSNEMRITEPPMMRQAWQFIVDASNELPELVPFDSTASKVSRYMINSLPWLLFYVDPRAGESILPPPDVQRAHEMLDDMLRGRRARLAHQLYEKVATGERELEPFEASLLSAITSSNRVASSIADSRPWTFRSGIMRLIPGVSNPEPTLPTSEGFFNAWDMPAGMTASTIQSLYEKLRDQ